MTARERRIRRAHSHVGVQHVGKRGPAFPRRVNTVSPGPPLNASSTHDDGSKQRLAETNLYGHRIPAVQFGELNEVRKIRDDVSEVLGPPALARNGWHSG